MSKQGKPDLVAATRSQLTGCSCLSNRDLLDVVDLTSPIDDARGPSDWGHVDVVCGNPGSTSSPDSASSASPSTSTVTKLRAIQATPITPQTPPPEPTIPSDSPKLLITSSELWTTTNPGWMDSCNSGRLVNIGGCLEFGSGYEDDPGIPLLIGGVSIGDGVEIVNGGTAIQILGQQFKLGTEVDVGGGTRTVDSPTSHDVLQDAPPSCIGDNKLYFYAEAHTFTARDGFAYTKSGATFSSTCF